MSYTQLLSRLGLKKSEEKYYTKQRSLKKELSPEEVEILAALGFNLANERTNQHYWSVLTYINHT
jgi:hypothetical protein